MAQRSEVTLSKGPRFQFSKGLLTVLVSTVVLFIISAVVAPTSVSPGPLGSMIPFAAILAIVGLGQMLVIQQAGIDLSVPGSVSLAAVIVSALPEIEDDRLLSAVILALVVAIAIGVLNGFLVGFLKLNPIIATLGTNSLLFGFVMLITQGIPRMTTALLLSVVSGSTFGIRIHWCKRSRGNGVGSENQDSPGHGVRVGTGALRNCRNHDCRRDFRTQRLDGQRLSSSLGRRGRTGWNFSTWWPWSSHRHRHCRRIPFPARSIRSRAWGQLRHPHIGSSSSTRNRCCHLHSGLVSREIAPSKIPVDSTSRGAPNFFADGLEAQYACQ